MDYSSAAKIRKKSFGTLLAEQEGGLGSSLKSTISQKTQANIAGLKETFDPMNIAKKMTFGSNWAPAMLGKLTGRKAESIAHFTGARLKNRKLGRSAAVNDNDDSEVAPTPAIESVKAIHKLLKDREKQIKTWNKNDDKFDRVEKKEELKRHSELLKALSLKRVKIKEEKKQPTPTGEQPKPTKPAEPTKKPTEPAKKPGEPAKKPTEPTKKPTEPAKKQEPAPKKQEPTPKREEPAQPPKKQEPVKKEEKPAERKQERDTKKQEDRQRAEREKAERERADREKAARDKADKDKAAKDKADKEAKDAKDKADKEAKEAKDKADKESKDAKEQADRESRVAKDRSDRERAAREKSEREAREKAEAERKSAERVKKEEPKRQEPAQREPAQPPKKAEAPTAQPAPRPTTAKPGGPRTAEMIRTAGVGVVAALTAVGVTNVYAQKAILQTSYKESRIDVKSNESTAADYLATLNKRGYSYIQQTFPQLKPGGRLAKKLGYEKEGVPESVVRKAMESGNEVFYDMMYGGTMGNSDPGDGWKYRGRGLVAITGKDNYATTSKTLKEMGVNIDLVKDPDALTNPDVAYKAAAAYYANTLGGKGGWKSGMQRLNSYSDRDVALRDMIRATAGMGHNVKDFENGQGTGDKATGSHLYVNYQRALAASGEADKIMELSGSNAQIRSELNNQGPATTVVNNTTVNNTTQTAGQRRTRPDDRPAPDVARGR